MGYLSLARFAGDPNELLRSYERSKPTMTAVGRDHGLLVNRTDQKVVRMLPPLTIEIAELDRALEILDGVLADVGAEVHA